MVLQNHKDLDPNHPIWIEPLYDSNYSHAVKQLKQQPILPLIVFDAIPKSKMVAVDGLVVLSTYTTRPHSWNWKRRKHSEKGLDVSDQKLLDLWLVYTESLFLDHLFANYFQFMAMVNCFYLGLSSWLWISHSEMQYQLEFKQNNRSWTKYISEIRLSDQCKVYMPRGCILLRWDSSSLK